MQRDDFLLAYCFELAVTQKLLRINLTLIMLKVVYCLDWGVVTQAVVPTPFRHQVLLLAHETHWSVNFHKNLKQVVEAFFGLNKGPLWPSFARPVTSDRSKENTTRPSS